MSRGLRAAVVLLVVMAGWAAFRQFGNTVRFPISDDWFEALLKMAFWVAPVAIALRLLGAARYRDVAVELGLINSAWRGYVFAIAASLPMLMPVLLSGALRAVPVAVLASAVVVSPFAEEVFFRGWLFRQLTRRCGWPPVVALLVSALAFGLAHVSNLTYVTEPWALATATSAAAAGLLFGWLAWRWDSLWPAIGLHACMNLSAQAGGTSLATIGRFATIGLAVVLTFVFRRTPTRQWRREAMGQRGNEAMGQ